MTRAPLVVEAARELTELVEANADEAERRRRLPRRVVDALCAAELLRMGVPQCYDGPECDPLAMLDAVETVSAADGATGWCVMIASTTSLYSAFLDPAGAERLFASRKSIAAGVVAPAGTATAQRDGGWKVSGRWQWGSGTSHSQWIGGGVQSPDGPRLMFFPRADVEIHDTWYSMGLRGSASNAFSVDEVEVPEELSFTVGAGPQVPCPLAAFPPLTLLAANVAAVALGVARHALDEFVELAAVTQPQFSARTLAATGSVQADFADAEGALAAGRAYLRAEVADAWAMVGGGGQLDQRARARLRLAAIGAATLAADAVERVYRLGGGSSLFESSPLQRCLRDVNVITQHVMVGRRLREPLGKAMLGGDVDGSMW